MTWPNFISGGRGSGKTTALVEEALRNTDNPKYRGAIFAPNVFASNNIKRILDDTLRVADIPVTRRYSSTDYIFPSGAVIRVDALTGRRHQDYGGCNYQFMGFDHINEFQHGIVKYMLSRMRTFNDPEVPKPNWMFTWEEI